MSSKQWGAAAQTVGQGMVAIAGMQMDTRRQELEAIRERARLDLQHGYRMAEIDAADRKAQARQDSDRDFAIALSDAEWARGAGERSMKREEFEFKKGQARERRLDDLATTALAERQAIDERWDDQLENLMKTDEWGYMSEEDKATAKADIEARRESQKGQYETVLIERAISSMPDYFASSSSEGELASKLRVFAPTQAKDMASRMWKAKVAGSTKRSSSQSGESSLTATLKSDGPESLLGPLGGAGGVPLESGQGPTPPNSDLGPVGGVGGVPLASGEGPPPPPAGADILPGGGQMPPSGAQAMAAAGMGSSMLGTQNTGAGGDIVPQATQKQQPQVSGQRAASTSRNPYERTTPLTLKGSGVMARWVELGFIGDSPTEKDAFAKLWTMGEQAGLKGKALETYISRNIQAVVAGGEPKPPTGAETNSPNAHAYMHR